MASEKITAAQLLLPLSLVSFVLVVFLGFQTTLLVSDGASLKAAHTDQEKPLEQVAKIKDQANALAVGTLKLSESGNKDAQNIVAQLKKAGVNIQENPTGGAPTGTPGPAPASAPLVP